VKITTENITPETAAKWLAEHNRSNRKLRPSRVRQYAQQMTRGQWMLTGDPVRFAADGRLLDGQHRLAAIVESGTTITAVVIRGVADDVFKVLDSGLGRSPADALDVHVQNARQKAAAVRLLYVVDCGGDPRNRDDQSAVSRVDVADYHAEHAAALDYAASTGSKLYKAFSGGNASAWTAFVVLAGRASATHSEEFLEGVYSGANLSPGDPRLALRNWLSNNRRLPTAGHHLGLLIKAWNAWMGGATRAVMILRDDEAFPVLATRRKLTAKSA
jgi:hypothetical protein